MPFLPDSADAGEVDIKSAVVGYGRIVRDEEGNVIDIILPEDEEKAEKAEKEEEGEESDAEPAPVEAKTDVVRCKSSPHLASTGHWIKWRSLLCL